MKEHAHAPAPEKRGGVRREPALQLRPADDRFEREADTAAAALFGPGGAGALTSAPSPRRDGRDGQGGRLAPDSVAKVVASPGRPLAEPTRRMMEAHFCADFSRVRIHADADADAATSARALDALAYTAGAHIVFARDAYAPDTRRGRRLIAHELAHVVQQGGAGARPSIVQRLGVFESIGVFLGLVEGEFSEKELGAYLAKITKDDTIEGSYDSDNKARAIVRRWKKAEAAFRLTPRQRVLLIKEMLDGPTLGGDEAAILDLLELSDKQTLRDVFGATGVTVKELESDIDGDNFKRLQAFFAKRFKGGRDALLKGVVTPQGDPGTGAPAFAIAQSVFEARLKKAKDRNDPDILTFAGEIFGLDPVSRDASLRNLGALRDGYSKLNADFVEKLSKESDKAKKTTLEQQIRANKLEQRKVDRLLQLVFKDIALSTSGEDLAIETRAPDAAAADIRKALKPDVKVDASGAAIPFAKKDAPKYEADMRAFLPKMVQSYYDIMVKGKGPAVHANPKKIHPLAEFERIGNASKDETDAVFGQYYDTSKKPQLKADTAAARGNIHDLFADTVENLKGMTSDEKREMARQLVIYFFQSDDDIRAKNYAINASPQFDKNNKPLNDEAKILDKLADEYVKSDPHVAQLNEIDRNWDASAGAGDINIQIFKKDTPDEDRDFLWDMFQTLIHEYIHTLRDSAYDAFANSFGPSSNENNTLIEGVDSLLDEIVWEHVAPRVNDPALRAKVEGPEYAKKPPLKVIVPAFRRRYASYAEAVKLVNIVGIRNLYAAYFQGDVKKIGG